MNLLASWRHSKNNKNRMKVMHSLQRIFILPFSNNPPFFDRHLTNQSLNIAVSSRLLGIFPERCISGGIIQQHRMPIHGGDWGSKNIRYLMPLEKHVCVPWNILNYSQTISFSFHIKYARKKVGKHFWAHFFGRTNRSKSTKTHLDGALLNVTVYSAAVPYPGKYSCRNSFS